MTAASQLAATRANPTRTESELGAPAPPDGATPTPRFGRPPGPCEKTSGNGPAPRAGGETWLRRMWCTREWASREAAAESRSPRSRDEGADLAPVGTAAAYGAPAVQPARWSVTGRCAPRARAGSSPTRIGLVVCDRRPCPRAPGRAANLVKRRTRGWMSGPVWVGIEWPGMLRVEDGRDVAAGAVESWAELGVAAVGAGAVVP